MNLRLVHVSLLVSLGSLFLTGCQDGAVRPSPQTQADQGAAVQAANLEEMRPGAKPKLMNLRFEPNRFAQGQSVDLVVDYCIPGGLAAIENRELYYKGSLPGHRRKESFHGQVLRGDSTEACGTLRRTVSVVPTDPCCFSISYQGRVKANGEWSNRVTSRLSYVSSAPGNKPKGPKTFRASGENVPLANTLLAASPCKGTWATPDGEYDGVLTLNFTGTPAALSASITDSTHPTYAERNFDGNVTLLRVLRGDTVKFMNVKEAPYELKLEGNKLVGVARHGRATIDLTCKETEARTPTAP